MSNYLGIDCGGTKSLAVMVDSAGVSLGSGLGGPGNIASNDDFTLRRSLSQCITGARSAAGHLISDVEGEIESVCVGVAGYSAEERRAAFQSLLGESVSAKRYRIEPDYFIAYWGATHGEPGIAVVAGTGAVAFGKNAEGRTFRADGLGYLLGDHGSGFDLGIQALRYTLQQMTADRSDTLSNEVLQHTGASRQTEVIQWLYGNFSPTRVASLSPIVGALAESGDGAARNLVAEMARRLRHTVREVRHKLWMPRDIPVYPLGGLWQLGSFFRSEFIEPTWQGANGVVMAPEPGTGGYFNLREPKSDAVYGAALLAMRDD